MRWGARADSHVNTLVEASRFLFARIGSIDKKGDPNVHPVWYYFENDKIYFETGKDARKAQNIKKRSKIYFCQNYKE